jgi:hypothetical protein
MGSIETGFYTGPSQTLAFNGFLFDFDGTIVDSTAAIEKHWRWYVESYPFLQPAHQSAGSAKNSVSTQT